MTANQDEQPAANGVEPHLGRHGKVSYMEIPAPDPDSLASFYSTVFGWKVRGVGSNHVGFDDVEGGLIGHFTSDRKVVSEPGVVPYLYVDGVDRTLDLARANGGRIEREPYPEGQLWVATLRDPAGNLIGIWQGGGR